MSDELLERLRRENPVPGRMPDLPLEAVLTRLDDEGPPTARRSGLGSDGPSRAFPIMSAVASVAIVVTAVAVVLTVRSHGRSVGASSSPTAPVRPPRPRPGNRPRVNLGQTARNNVRDTPLPVFQRNPGVIAGPLSNQPKETVIPSTVRELGTFSVAGVGRIQYWVADTRQNGICGALRLPDGDWAGLDNGGRDGGEFPACYPPRRQIGSGALIIDGFDYLQTTVPSHNGQRWYILYGAVSGGGDQVPVRVLDTVSKRGASLVRNHYFAIALHPVGNDYGDDVHLEAFDASGRRIATQGKSLPGTPGGANQKRPARRRAVIG